MDVFWISVKGWRICGKRQVKERCSILQALFSINEVLWKYGRPQKS